MFMFFLGVLYFWGETWDILSCLGVLDWLCSSKVQCNNLAYRNSKETISRSLRTCEHMCFPPNFTCLCIRFLLTFTRLSLQGSLDLLVTPKQSSSLTSLLHNPHNLIPTHKYKLGSSTSNTLNMHIQSNSLSIYAQLSHSTHTKIPILGPLFII